MLEQKFEQVFTFMSRLYAGNWVYRWAKVPFIEQKGGEDRGESVLTHQYSCIALWSLLQKIMPAISKVIDSTRVTDMLMYHDIGEIGLGDTPLVTQLSQGSESKNQSESVQIDEYAKLLPEELREWMTESFKSFTYGENNTEALMARYINAVQGNHFALTFGKDLEAHNELIQKIVNQFFMPIARELFTELGKLSVDAGNEIEALTQFHLEAIKAKNIRL
jgi:5'-deoxynucleotidase YfbR-like HD superfamily hydrolase